MIYNHSQNWIYSSMFPSDMYDLPITIPIKWTFNLQKKTFGLTTNIYNHQFKIIKSQRCIEVKYTRPMSKRCCTFLSMRLHFNRKELISGNTSLWTAFQIYLKIALCMCDMSMRTWKLGNVLEMFCHTLANGSVPSKQRTLKKEP